MSDPRNPASTSEAAGPETAPGERPARPAAPPRTRTAAAYKGLIIAAIVLVLLLVFILENTRSVKISYFGASWHMALGIALLLAAAAGALLTGLVASVRMTQLRRHAKRQRRRG